MEPLTVGGIVGLVALAAFAGGYGLARVLDRLRITSAQTRINEMLAQAKSQADNFQKEAELKAKDELFQRREALTREFDEKLNEVRDQERRLDKREDSLEEKGRDLQKREKDVEQQRKKLTERKEQVEKRSKDLDSVIQQQTQKLHEISHLNRDQAEKLLIDRLEKELSVALAERVRRFEETLR